jgi:hypothetical protein
VIGDTEYEYVPSGTLKTIVEDVEDSVYPFMSTDHCAPDESPDS